MLSTLEKKMVKESTLPQREKQLFHKLVKCYEQKQFKQGLKHAKEYWSESESSSGGWRENFFFLNRPRILDQIQNRVISKTENKIRTIVKSILTNPACKDHGETLSMKGLILSAMNKKEEALELAKQGLKNDFKSGTCWHVYGLILRAEKKYDDAIKVNI